MNALTVRQFVKDFSKHKGKVQQVTDFGEPVGTWVPVGHSKSTARAAALVRLCRQADKAKPKPLDADAIGIEVRRRRGERA